MSFHHEQKTAVRYFPFSPGIPWKMEKGIYVIPEISGDTWNNVLKDKKLIVLAHGGLLESFFSLSLIEALAKIEPEKELFWAGKKEFIFLNQINGIAKYIECDDISTRFPVPLFFDKENNAYFNCLNNFGIKSKFYKKGLWPNKKIVFDQIYSNLMVPWNVDYLPKIRITTEKYKQWKADNKIYDGIKYIVLIESTWLDINNNSLNWSYREIKEFVALMNRFRIPIIVSAKDERNYYGTQMIKAPTDKSILFQLIKDSWALLSCEIDWLFIALCISKAHIFSEVRKKQWDLIKNAEYVSAENNILLMNKITPIDVYLTLEGLQNV